MKKQYSNPEILCLAVSENDILTLSNKGSEGGTVSFQWNDFIIFY